MEHNRRQATSSGKRRHVGGEMGNGVARTSPAVHQPKRAKQSGPKRRLGLTGPLARQRAQLPIFDARDALVEAVRANKSIIVVGETGSGKTTQLPQYLLEAGLGDRGAIACTQPRRVAAVTVAQRVAKERGVALGTQVGYRIRFDNKTSSATTIKYMTDGMLLREVMGDRQLSKYSVILLDEAHERTVHTDVLFALLKEVQAQRPALRLVIMSATLDAAAMGEYFDAPVLYVSGRTHPVQVKYTCEPVQDYVDAALTTILQVHRQEPPGDILVFLTGQDEIESLEGILRDAAKSSPEDTGEFVVFPLYGALPPQEQLKAFGPAPNGARKVILATNIAETSVTISGIKYVVDTGMVKERAYNARSGLDTLGVLPVSMAQARQRSGRAGREAAGTCYRLFTEDGFRSLAETTTPEIARANLSSVVLMLLSLGVSDILNFDWMTPPAAESLVAALELLINLEAVDAEGQLTASGKRMVDFPLDPRLARVVLASQKYHCAEEIISIVALMSVESIFFSPNNVREKAEKAKRKFLAPEGDQTTMLAALRAYNKMKSDRSWCYENFINVRSMKTVLETRKQIRDLCVRNDVEITSAGDDTIGYRRCLLYGLFVNTAQLQPDGSYKAMRTGEETYIHPTSALFSVRPRPRCILFNEMVKTNKRYMRDCCVLNPDWLAEDVPHYFARSAG